MKDDPRPAKHQLDHAVPTVIHHPEEDLPVLARWLHNAMEDQVKFWSVLGGIVFVVIALTVLMSTIKLGGSSSDGAWTRLDAAKTADERVKIAEEFPNSPVERWALLDAATEFYEKGFADLPNNREAAMPELERAFKYFEQVAKEAPKDNPQARTAAFGMARTLEARNQLQKAIEQYETVAKTWPGTDEAKLAEQLAQALRKPESINFYKELYAFKPSEVSLPPLGQGSVNLPPNHPPIGSGSALEPFMFPPPPPPPPPATAKDATPAPDLPADVFTPEPAKGTPAPAAPNAKAAEPMPKP